MSFESFETTVLETVDAYQLLLFKQMFPKRDSYWQEHIVCVFVQEKFVPHNAMNYVLSLQNLCNVIGASVDYDQHQVVLFNQLFVSGGTKMQAKKMQLY